MNIIILGCGNIGGTLAEELTKENHNVTIVDIRRDIVEPMANKLDVLGVVGNCANQAVLKEAGIKQANLVIAATSLDELNVLSCLIARKTGHCHTIARVRNPIYMGELSLIKEELGLSMTLNPDMATAIEIYRVLRFPSAIEIDTFAKGRMELLKFKVAENSPLDHFMLSDISSQLGCDVLVCAVERDGKVIIPDGAFLLQAKDVVSFVAAPENALKFFQVIGIMSSPVRSAMLVGGGDITYYLTRMLLATGVSVTVVEKDSSRCDYLADEFPRATIICGDGTDTNLLMEEGFLGVEAFASLTNMDEENILLSLYVKSKSKAKLVTKVHRVAYDDVVDGLDLGTVVCPKNVTAESVIQYVRAMENSRDSNIETLYQILEGRAEALEFFVRNKSSVVDVPLRELQIRKGILVCSIVHEGRAIIPRGNDSIQVGDSVIIVTTHKGINNLTDILTHK